MNLKNAIPLKKALYVIIITFVILIMIGGLFLSVYSIYAFGGGYRIEIDLNKAHQIIEGFGASAAWFFQEMGAFNGVDSELFRSKAINYIYGDDGLKLNIFRYNIGAGSWDLYRNNIGDYQTHNDGKGRTKSNLTESFFIRERYTGDTKVFSDLNNYDITRDQYAVKMFKLALDTGNITRIVLFSNSPYYAFTKNGMCLSDNLGENNLKEEFFDAYSDYMILCSHKLYKEVIQGYGIDSSRVQISPVNEPQWDWNLGGSDQEGCHYDPVYLAKFYNNFYNRLNYWNNIWNTNYVMDVFESGSYMRESSTDIYDYLDEFKKYNFYQNIETLSLHSYCTDEKKAPRKDFAKSIGAYNINKISMSEYCDMIKGRDYSIKMAIRDSQIINRDLSMIDAVSWSWWLAVSNENFNSSLVYYDIDDKSTKDISTDDTFKFSFPKRYYALKHYSYFISEGDRRVETKNSDPLGIKPLDFSVYLKQDGSLIIVVTNCGNKMKVKLKGIDYKYLDTFVTTETVDWEYEQKTNEKEVNIPKNSIVTIHLYNS